MTTGTDRMITEALSRVHYAIAANARWQSIQIAKSFKEARDQLLAAPAIFYALGPGGGGGNGAPRVTITLPRDPVPGQIIEIMMTGGGGGGGLAGGGGGGWHNQLY